MLVVPGGRVIDVEEGLAGVLDVNPVLGPVVPLKGLESLAGEGGGGVEVGAQLSHVEVLRLVLIFKTGLVAFPGR